MRLRPVLILVPALLLAACPDEDGGLDLDLIESTERPSKRSEVLAAADEGSNTVLMFGGNEGPIVNQNPRSQFLDETWLFEPGFGWISVDTEGPHARGRYALAHDPDGGRAFLFGGRWRADDAESTDSYRLYNDLWVFDFESRTWTELDDGGGEAPAGRYYSEAAWDAATSTLWLFGGATNPGWQQILPSNEVWSWTEGAGWQEHQTTGDEPSLRVFYGATHDTKRNRLVLFGGHRGDFQSQAFNDLYSLDFDELEWRRHDRGGDGAPSTRMHGMLNYDALRDRYVLMGGHTDIGDANDVWSFPPDDDRWIKIRQGDEFSDGVDRLGCLDNPSEVPADYVVQDLDSPERRHRGLNVVFYDNLWIFGGMHAECSDHLDDTWRFAFEDEQWRELIESRTGESCLRRGADCDCLCL